LHEKARAGRNGRPFLLAHAAWVAAGRKAWDHRLRDDFQVAKFSVCAPLAGFSSRRQALRFYCRFVMSINVKLLILLDNILTFRRNHDSLYFILL
jgi:hypothetical protein